MYFCRKMWLLVALMIAVTWIASASGSFPELNGDGFLPEGEFVYEDAELGEWRYASQTLRIEIFRKRNATQNLTWYEADIYTAGNERFHMIPKNPAKRMEQMDFVHNIARENGVVFALSSDFAHSRIQQRSIPGILIRDGQIISNKTRTPKTMRFPNLDTLAIFSDGDMRVYRYNEYTAEEYLQMGAVDVLAFGPIMIRDGETDWELVRKYTNYREPRTGIGMVEIGHYVAIMVEGRHEKSRGITTTGLAELFRAKGCTLALNLDGGQSATMVFMGNQIIRVGQTTSLNKSARRTAEILGIGFSQKVLDSVK